MIDRKRARSQNGTLETADFRKDIVVGQWHEQEQKIPFRVREVVNKELFSRENCHRRKVWTSP
jgi:hypothetical protein